MKIEIPRSWQEMTDYQQREVIDIIQRVDNEDFTESYMRIVQIMLMKDDSVSSYLYMRKVLREFPVSSFREDFKFLWDNPQLWEFPNIEGLDAPALRMGDVSIKQFSFCDTLMHRYTEDKKEVYLRQLVATLYRFPKTDFDELKLREVAQITDALDIKEAQRIGFIYSCVRQYLSDSYPSIFVKRKDEEAEKPVFKKKYTPFSQIITLMAADELRLLGNLHECQNTKLYDFMNAFLESKRIHEMKSKMK